MRGRTVLLAAALLAVAMTASPAAAAPPAGPGENQVYYTVTASYQGAPESVYEVAARFLGDANRAREIVDLNSGRIQPDGGRLTDPGRLRAGWQLVLPYDAAGADLHYGTVPTGSSRASACPWVDAPASAAWGQSLLTPSRAWSETDGAGVRIAVIGTGVDGNAPGLSGRVLTGADIAAGTGRGDTGCGDGTNLAGIVAGDDGNDGKLFGVAPGARIVPIRTGGGEASAQTVGTALRVATQAGARVVLVGARVDAANPVVRAAIGEAVARDAVVVLAAPAMTPPADGLLRVGAAGQDRRPVESYPDGTVDLLAPGQGVATVGGSVTGARYAAAFVAGTAALVRAAHPGLRAAEVAAQVRATAAEGLVNPAAAVTAALPASAGVNAVVAAPANGLRTLSRVLVGVAVLLAVALLLVFPLRRIGRAMAGPLARRRARRRAQVTRARMANDGDDPFWEPPAAEQATADLNAHPGR